MVSPDDNRGNERDHISRANEKIAAASVPIAVTA